MCYQEKKSDTTVLLAKKIQNICITASCEKFKKAFFYKVGVRSFSNYAESENQKETLFLFSSFAHFPYPYGARYWPLQLFVLSV